jgi:chemotaxis signal transduction protein
VVRVGGAAHALRVSEVVEVVRPLPVAELPRMPRFVRGAAQFRSEVIAVVELAARLGLAPEWQEGKTRLVVVQAPAGRAGLLVEEIAGVWRDGVVRGAQVERGNERVPLVNISRVLNWRGEPG